MKLKFVVQAAIVFAALGVLRATPAHALDLVKDGRPVAAIVLPAQTEYDAYVKAEQAATEASLAAKQPTMEARQFNAEKTRTLAVLANRLKATEDDEKVAAEELQSIIEKISGAKLPIQRVENLAVPAGPTIQLGAALAHKAGFGAQLDRLDRDGLLCVARGDALFLSGRRARGTLFAAYEFLESLGCRWVMPGEFGEIYPTLRTISTNINKTANPSHSQRYWWCTFGNAPEYSRWTLRTKGTFVKGPGDQTIAQGHALAGPLRWGATQEKYRVMKMEQVSQPKLGADGKPLKDANGKTVMETVEKEVASLPDEFYAMHNGKPSHANPNFSNPKVWDMYADYYINHFNNNPGVDYVSISAEDGLVIDERPSSKRLASNENDWTLGAYSATDQLWFFHNRVIERVVKVHPTKKFGVLVYANNMMPPRLEKIHPNMALVFAPLGICPLHHVRDDKCKTNRAYHQWFEDWMFQARAAGAETYYYDYEPTGYSWNMAMICPRWGIIGRNYPYFHERGLDGHTTQGHDDWASSGLNNYLMQKLYWDASLNYKDVIADYAKARFGAAAPAMIEYYNLLEKRMDEIPDLLQNEVWGNHLVLTPEVRKAAREVLARAVKMADTDRAKAHVETMVLLQRSTDAACDAEEIMRETGDYGKAAQRMETIFEIRDQLNKHYAKFMNPNRVDKTVRAQFLTGGIYNQYLGFDKKIKESAASVVLPRYWKGMLDTGNRAWSQGYHKPEVSVAKLEDQDTTLVPDIKYGTEREVAAFFYRTEVNVPQSFAGKKATIYFPSIIAKALQIWVNGQPVEFDYENYKDTIWRGPDYFWVNYDHSQEFDITPHLKPGQKNTIAFRAFKSFDFGGTYRRMWLLAN